MCPNQQKLTGSKSQMVLKGSGNFPNCIGALDGKQVVIQAPPGSGSLYFNDKGTFSMVLMALVGHQYCFIVVDIGAYNRNSDGGIYFISMLRRALKANTMNVPQDDAFVNAPEKGPMFSL